MRLNIIKYTGIKFEIKLLSFLLNAQLYINNLMQQALDNLCLK